MRQIGYLAVACTAAAVTCGIIYLGTVDFPGRGIVAGGTVAGMVYTLMGWAKRMDDALQRKPA